MKKTFITIFIIFLAVITLPNFVSAENGTEEMINYTEEESYENAVKERKDENKVTSTQQGNYNITFNNGYNGYCVDYGDHAAGINDTFNIKDTSNIVNEKTGESVGNYLKVFFTDFHEIAMKDKIVTQHIIWHFTDDFNSWRIDPKLIDEIKFASSNKKIPDSGFILKINDTTQAIFEFIMFDSTKSNHQNFFGYKMTYENIKNEIENNTSQNITNSTNNTLNTTANITAAETSKENKNISILKTGANKNLNISKTEVNKTDSSIGLEKHITGQSRPLGISLFVILLCLVGVLYLRDWRK